MEKSSHPPTINSIKVEKENSYKSTLEDQIKEEKLDNVCQIYDPLQLQQLHLQQNQRQNQQQSQQQRVELRVSNDEINMKFCISWIKANYRFVKKSTIKQQDMYQHYLTSLKKFFSKKYVISLSHFSNCVRCVNYYYLLYQIDQILNYFILIQDCIWFNFEAALFRWHCASLLFWN